MASTTTIIIGSGIIGLSTAYYLSESPRTQAQSIHLIESSPELFNCASGLAAGFLAADWFAPSVAPLGALSFKLHKELAEKFNGKETWGYSRSTGTSLTQDTDSAVSGSGEDWLRDGTSRANAARLHTSSEGIRPLWLTKKNGDSLEVISGDDTVAQVDPKRLCEFLLKECLKRGVTLHYPAQVVSVSKDARDELAGVRIAAAHGIESDIPCTRLVITAGAWSSKIFTDLFPSASIKIPISPLAGHSLLVKSPRWSREHEVKGCHAVFATDTLGFSPELFSRIGEEIYIAGLNSTNIPLPKVATDAKIQLAAIEQLKGVAKRMLGILDQDDDLQVLREGLCFRPVTPSGRPIVSKIPDDKLGGGFSTRGGGAGGVFVAAGHGAWGISQSLGTGKTLSELLDGRPTSANIKALTI